MKVVFEFAGGERVETDAYRQLNLLAHVQILERDLQSRCGGHHECGTCRVIVESGGVSPMRQEERELLELTGALAADPRFRLACQTFPEPGAANDAGQVVVRVPSDKFVDARGKKLR